MDRLAFVTEIFGRKQGKKYIYIFTCIFSRAFFFSGQPEKEARRNRADARIRAKSNLRKRRQREREKGRDRWWCVTETFPLSPETQAIRCKLPLSPYAPSLLIRLMRSFELFRFPFQHRQHRGYRGRLHRWKSNPVASTSFLEAKQEQIGSKSAHLEEPLPFFLVGDIDYRCETDKKERNRLDSSVNFYRFFYERTKQIAV